MQYCHHQVRDGAMSCLVEIYRHVGERVRMDLSKKGLPQSRYDNRGLTTCCWLSQHVCAHSSSFYPFLFLTFFCFYRLIQFHMYTNTHQYTHDSAVCSGLRGRLPPMCRHKEAAGHSILYTVLHLVAVLSSTALENKRDCGG